MTLDHLTERAARERELRRKADAALAAGILTKAEYDYYLREELGLRPETPTDIAYAQPTRREQLAAKRRRTAQKAGATLALLALLLTTLWFLAPQQAGLSGFVTYTPTSSTQTLGETMTSNTTIPLNVTTLLGLRVSGTLVNGSGSIWLVSESERLLVWQGSAVPAPAVWTPFTSYALNESVNVTVVPTTAEYTLWLTDGSGEKTPVENGFRPDTPGTYTLDALLNSSGNITKVSTTLTVRNETNTSNDEPREPLLPSTTFTDACSETCMLNTTGNLSLLIETDGQLTIDTITLTTPQTNNPPINTKPIPNLTLTIGETVTLNLDEYFTDPDNDTLTYDYLQTSNARFNLKGSNLTITATNPGAEQSVLYASDTNTITQSNLYTITINEANNQSNNTNETTTNETTPPPNNTNETTNETNTQPPTTTDNTTTNETATPPPTSTNNTQNITLNCTNPDPNKRPIGCLQEDAALFFKPQPIPIENLDRAVVGRLTPIGNLLIKGTVVEHSTGGPDSRDFAITRIGEYGEQTPVAWIDSQTGNLHLTGRLYEEELNMAPPRGAYVVQNSQSVTIAYVDRQTGDLHLMGNLIPYRRSLEVKS